MINPNGLHMVVGPTGSGKSTFMMEQMGIAVAKSDRTVFTNFPIIWEGLVEKMNEEFPRKDKAWTLPELQTRIYHTIDFKEIQKFWLSRGFRWFVADIDDEDYFQGLRSDYSVVYRYKEATAAPGQHRMPLYEVKAGQMQSMFERGEVERCMMEDIPGVEYIIDEASDFWPQLTKKKLGQSYLYALKYKRKIGRDGQNITLSMQYENQTDIELRQQSNSWIYLQNIGTRRKGMFRGPKKGRWEQFPNPAKRNDKGDLSGYFRVDAQGWGKTFDTSAGTGLVGGMAADTKAKIGGISWLWFFPITIAALLVVGFAVKGGAMKMPNVALWFVGRGAKVVTEAVPGVKEAPQTKLVETNNILAELKKLLEAQQRQAQPQFETNRNIWVTGMAKVPGKPMSIWLSDGRKYSVGTREVESVGPHWVRIERTWYSRTPIDSRSSPQVSVPVISQQAMAGMSRP